MDLPLFPLNTVLCPGVTLPLHVFEPRYRTMVRDCVARGTSFGVVFIRDGREVGRRPRSLASVGTIAELRQVDLLPDGRLDLVTIGGSRFVVDRVRPTADGYLVAAVSLLAEPIGDRVMAQRLASRVVLRFARYVTLLGAAPTSLPSGLTSPASLSPSASSSSTDRPTGPDPVALESAALAAGEDVPAADAAGSPATDALAIPRDPAQLSHLIAGIVQVELTRRQALLEAESAEERLAELAALLARENGLLARGLGPYLPDPRSLTVQAN